MRIGFLEITPELKKHWDDKNIKSYYGTPYVDLAYITNSPTPLRQFECEETVDGLNLRYMTKEGDKFYLYGDLDGDKYELRFTSYESESSTQVEDLGFIYSISEIVILSDTSTSLREVIFKIPEKHMDYKNMGEWELVKCNEEEYKSLQENYKKTYSFKKEYKNMIEQEDIQFSIDLLPEEDEVLFIGQTSDINEHIDYSDINKIKFDGGANSPKDVILKTIKAYKLLLNKEVLEKVNWKKYYKNAILNSMVAIFLEDILPFPSPFYSSRYTIRLDNLIGKVEPHVLLTKTRGTGGDELITLEELYDDSNIEYDVASSISNLELLLGEDITDTLTKEDWLMLNDKHTSYDRKFPVMGVDLLKVTYYEGKKFAFKVKQKYSGAGYINLELGFNILD